MNKNYPAETQPALVKAVLGLTAVAVGGAVLREVPPSVEHVHPLEMMVGPAGTSANTASVTVVMLEVSRPEKGRTQAPGIMAILG